MDRLTEWLEHWDQMLFLRLNGMHHPFFDFLMPWVSNKYIWIPLYLLLLHALIRNDRRKAFYVLLSVGLLILISDQTASGFLKPVVERLRPCYDPVIAPKVRLLKGCGGQYGFASSHASNAFAVATFCWLMLRQRSGYVWLLFIWATLVAYSRIYLGVHYPGDVMTGALIGIGAAYLTKAVFLKVAGTTGKLSP